MLADPMVSVNRVDPLGLLAPDGNNGGGGVTCTLAGQILVAWLPRLPTRHGIASTTATLLAQEQKITLYKGYFFYRLHMVDAQNSLTRMILAMTHL